MTSQPMYGMNQPSPYPTNMHAYPQQNMANPNIHQQDNIRPIYGFNQGTNQGPYPQTNGQVDPSAPPPSYDEIIGNPNSK